MDSTDFQALLAAKTDTEMLGPCLRDNALPFVFDTKPAAWDNFKAFLSKALRVDEADIVVVGSGRHGFSTKPGRNFRKFTDQSDVDVVIVHAERFDELWFKLLSAIYPKNYEQQFGGWIAERRNEIYTGWVTPKEIRLDLSIFGEKARPAKEFAFQWFQALQKASQFPSRRHKEVNARLYRSWSHVDLYHIYSLSELRRSLKQ